MKLYHNEIELDSKHERYDNTKNLVYDILNIRMRIDELKSEEDELKKKILKDMYERGISKFKTRNYTISLIEGRCSESFDKKRFKKEHSRLYKKYVELNVSSDYIMIRHNKNKKGNE